MKLGLLALAGEPSAAPCIPPDAARGTAATMLVTGATATGGIPRAVHLRALSISTLATVQMRTANRGNASNKMLVSHYQIDESGAFGLLAALGTPTLQCHHQLVALSNDVFVRARVCVCGCVGACVCMRVHMCACVCMCVHMCTRACCQP